MLPGQHLASVGMGLVCPAPPRATSRVPAGPSPGTGMGTGRSRRLAGARHGRPVARSRRSRRRIDALNYLAREREAAATATPRVRARGHARTRGAPRQGGWAPTAELQGWVFCHPLGRWVPAARGTPLPPAPLRAPPAAPACPQVVPPAPPALSPARHPAPGTMASPGWQHGAGRLQPAEGPPVFAVVPAGLLRLRRALSHGRPRPTPPAPLVSLL